MTAWRQRRERNIAPPLEGRGWGGACKGSEMADASHLLRNGTDPFPSLEREGLSDRYDQKPAIALLLLRGPLGARGAGRRWPLLCDRRLGPIGGGAAFAAQNLIDPALIEPLRR